MPATMQSAELALLKDKIKDIRIASLTTLTAGGDVHIRPMATQQMDEEGKLWFFTYENSAKVTEIMANNKIGLSFEDHSAETYVTIAGRAEVVKDKAKINELWSDLLKAWFPQGKEDPQLCLLKINLHQAEYWDRPGGKMVTLFEMIKATFTGESDKSARNEKLGS